MKRKIIGIGVFLMSVVIFSGCDDEILTTDFTVTLSQDFVVTEVNDSVYVKDTLVDAADQSGDIEKYKDQIEKVTVEKVTYLLTSFTGDNTFELQNGVISLSDITGVNTKNIVQLSNVNLMNLLNNETQLPADTSAVSLLATLVKNAPHQFKLHADGELNKTAFDFTLRLKIYLTIKAKVM